jgi:hypothetical protein
LEKVYYKNIEIQLIIRKTLDTLIKKQVLSAPGKVWEIQLVEKLTCNFIKECAKPNYRMQPTPYRRRSRGRPLKYKIA